MIFSGTAFKENIDFLSLLAGYWPMKILLRVNIDIVIKHKFYNMYFNGLALLI